MRFPIFVGQLFAALPELRCKCMRSASSPVCLKYEVFDMSQFSKPFHSKANGSVAAMQSAKSLQNGQPLEITVCVVSYIPVEIS